MINPRLGLVMLAAVSLSTAALTNEPRIASGGRERAGECSVTEHDHQAPTAAPQEGDKAPRMVSFTELKWVELPERKGMQFAVLSGDPKTGAYTQMRKVPAGTDNPLHAHSSELTNVIISGVWYTGADAASARDFGPGRS